MTRRILVILLFPVFLCQVVRAGDQPARLPPRLQVAILFKALSYDNNLRKRCGLSLRIGVLHGARQEDRDDARQMVREIQANTGRTVKGLALQVVDLEVRDIDQLDEALVEHGVNTVYLGTGLDHLVSGMHEMAARRNLVLMTGDARHVMEGASLGAVLQGTKPRILIHLERAREQGLEFDARLLRLADVVHGKR